MSQDDLTSFVESGNGIFDDNSEPIPAKKLQAVVADTYAFIRSVEANDAIASVTIEQLMGDQILRNGDSERSNKSKYDPYAYDSAEDEEASAEPVNRANYPGGSDTQRPTKLDRVLGIVNNLEDVISQIKEMEPADVISDEAFVDVADVAMPEE